MTQIGEAFVRVRADTSEFEGGVKKAASALAGLAIGKKTFDFFKGGVQQLGELEKVAAQTNAVLKSTGGVANVSGKEVEAYGSKIEQLTGIDQEQIQAGQNLLLTFKGVRNEVGEGPKVFDRARQAALDLSVAFGQDMTQSSVLVGKALENPLQGLTALQRVGVTFTAAQKETIKGLVETGDVAGAQAVILKELESQVGGSAAAYGDTLPAKLAIAKQAFGDMQQSMTVALLPAIELASSGVVAFTGFVEGLPGPLSTAIGLTGGLAASALFLARPLESLINIGSKVGDALTAAGGGAGLLAKALPFAAAAGGFAVLAGGALVALKLAGAFDEAHASAEQLAKFSGDRLVAEFHKIESGNRELGQSFQDTGRATVGIEEGIDRLGKKIESGADTYKTFQQLADIDIGKATAIRDSYAARGEDVSRFDKILRGVANAHRDGEGAADRNAAATDRFATKEKDAAKAAEDAKAVLDEMNQTLETQIDLIGELNGVNVDAAVSELEFENSLADVNTQLKDSNANLDINTQEGRDNKIALFELANESKSVAEAIARQTGSTDAGSAALQNMSTKLYETARATGMSEEAAARYVAELYGIPPERRTEIHSNAELQWILADEYKRKLDELDGKTVNTEIIETRRQRFIQEGSNVFGQHGLVTTGPLHAFIGEAGPEAVVPLGRTPTNKRDRDRVMKQAGLFQIQPMASGGIAGQFSTRRLDEQRVGPDDPALAERFANLGTYYKNLWTWNAAGGNASDVFAGMIEMQRNMLRMQQVMARLVADAVAESLPNSPTQRAKLRELEHYASTL